MTVRVLSLLAWVTLLACGGDDPGLRVGTADPSAGAAGESGALGIDNPSGGTGRIDITESALEVEIQHEALRVELITLSCHGECAEVEAVATGGHDPYTFAWNDGETSAVRRLCPSETTTFEVAATDTALETEELSYAPRTARAEVTAEVLRCAEDGGVPPTDPDCGPDATAAFLLIPRRESATTDVYVQESGNLPDYVSSQFGLTAPLAIVGSARREIHLGTCSQLLLAADAAGTKDVGWDDTMIVEYRSAPGAAIDKRWSYGVVSPITYQPTGEQLMSAAQATVPGWDLDPPVPNPVPFGYRAGAIDLMSDAPSAAKDFELTIHVLDASSLGSTTDIWLIPR